jgi:hypothetical protein
MLMDILRHGAEVEILEPAFLRDAVIEQIEAMVKIYQKELAAVSRFDTVAMHNDLARPLNEDDMNQALYLSFPSYLLGNAVREAPASLNR